MNPLSTRPRHATGSHRSGICLFAGAALGLGGVCGSATVRADDISWSNSNGGTFSVGTNWIGGVVPGTADFALFGRTRPGNPQQQYTVSFTTSPTNQGINVQDDAVTFDLNGRIYALTFFTAMRIGTSVTAPGGLTLTDGIVTTGPSSVVLIGDTVGATGSLTISTGAQLLGPEVQVGRFSPGSLFVQSGGDLVGGDLLLGIGGAAAPGFVTITGVGSNAVVEEMTIGLVGQGAVNIQAGGRIESTVATLGSSASAVGAVNVDGVNSRWTSSGDLTVGESGRGTMDITAGGQVACNTGRLGNRLASTGTVNVVGVNSRWTCSNDCKVGAEGSGTLNIGSGGRVECFRGAVGDILGSTGSVAITGGSQWLCTGEFIVGDRGLGSALVSGGSLVQSASGLIGIGDFAQDASTVAVIGAGAQWINSSDLTVGAFGRAQLSVLSGGEVRCANGNIASRGGQSSVSVSGAGSSLTATGNISVGGDIAHGFNGGTASLDIDAGGTVSAGGVVAIFPLGEVTLRGGTLDAANIGLAFSSGGVFSFLGGVLHSDGVGFSLLNQGGTLAPGHSAGSTFIAGDYTQQAGTMEIEIGGTTPGTQFDRITCGAASLGGTLDLRLINGFVPSPVQSFTILDASTIAGAFANGASGHRVPISNAAGSFVVHYGPASPFDPTNIVLSNFGPCPADFDSDGTIDFFDYDTFVICFEGGPCPPGKTADFDADGTIDFFDYDSFVVAFESGC
ncbi:MAG: hypothetical protein AABZ53_13185 [Planctomycetota bacterium]